MQDSIRLLLEEEVGEEVALLATPVAAACCGIIFLRDIASNHVTAG
jgi:hypothetical protein